MQFTQAERSVVSNYSRNVLKKYINSRSCKIPFLARPTRLSGQHHQRTTRTNWTQLLARVSIVAFTFSEYSELGTSLHETPIKWHKFTFAKDKCKSFNHRLFSFSKNFNVTTSIRFIVRLFKQISDEVVSME